MKRVGFSVRRNFPAFRQAGNRARRFRIKPRQSFKHPDDDAQFRLAGDDGRVERFRLRAVDDGHVGGRLAAGAAGNQDANRDAKNKTRPRKKSPGAFGKGHRVTWPVSGALVLAGAVIGSDSKLFVDGAAAGCAVRAGGGRDWRLHLLLLQLPFQTPTRSRR